MLRLETAKALKEAGLKWEPEIGDNFKAYNGIIQMAIKRNADVVETNFGRFPKETMRADSIWLPRLDQLLADIEVRGWTWVLYAPNDEGKCGIDIGKETLCRSNLLAMGDSPEEAAAQALLWILRQEKGDRK